MIPMLWLQLYVFGRPQVQFRRPVLYTAFLVQAVLVTLAVQFSPAFLSLPGFLAGSVLLVLPSRLAWPAFALIAAGMGWKYATLTNSPLEITYAALTTVVTGLVVYGLTRCPTWLSNCTRHGPNLPRWPWPRSGCGSPGTCTICLATASRRSRSRAS